MSAYRKAVRERDDVATRLGHVPRSLRVPKAPGSLLKLRGLLEDRAHRAMVRRITSRD